MAENDHNPDIVYLADKVYVHQWPLDSPPWPLSFKEKVDFQLNQNKKKKKIMIKGQQIKIDDFEFNKVGKFGVTIPLFKKETTIVFEAQIDDLWGHIHVTTHAKNYLEIFNFLMGWKNITFSD